MKTLVSVGSIIKRTREYLNVTDSTIDYLLVKDLTPVGFTARILDTTSYTSTTYDSLITSNQYCTYDILIKNPALPCSTITDLQHSYPELFI